MMEIVIKGVEERTEADKNPQFELFINGDSKGTFHSCNLEFDTDGKSVSYLFTGIDRK